VFSTIEGVLPTSNQSAKIAKIGKQLTVMFNNHTPHTSPTQPYLAATGDSRGDTLRYTTYTYLMDNLLNW